MKQFWSKVKPKVQDIAFFLTGLTAIVWIAAFHTQTKHAMIRPAEYQFGEYEHKGHDLEPEWSMANVSNMPPLLPPQATYDAARGYWTFPTQALTATAWPKKKPAHAKGLDDRAFNRLIAECYEPDERRYTSRNLVSNERSYLQIFPWSQKLVAPGGVYIGVAPDQNFTYISKFKPDLAFIVDIRRENMIEVLMFKALTELAPDRLTFLRTLFARNLDFDALLDAPIGSQDGLLETKTYARMLRQIAIPLTEEDAETLAEVYHEFTRLGGAVRCDVGSNPPTYRELIREKDEAGNLGHWMTDDESYRIVREMHLTNRIVPLVGDFAGKRTLQGLARWLRSHDLRVSAFYVDGVEYWLWSDAERWGQWVANLKALPLTDNSIIVRGFYSYQAGEHPLTRAGYPFTTLIQRWSTYKHDKPEGYAELGKVYERP